MSLIAPEHRSRLAERFAAELESPVALSLARHTSSCQVCDAAEALLDEISTSSPLLRATTETLAEDDAVAPKVGIDRSDETRHLRFLGLPAGHELPPFIDAVVARSTGRSDLAPPVAAALAGLQDDYLLKVFTMPT